MKFKEFKSLIEERKRLVHGVDKEKNFLRIQEIDEKLCPGKYKDLDKSTYLDWMKSEIYLMFEVGCEKIEKMLKIYFKDQECNMSQYTTFNQYEEASLGMEITTTKQTYDLGCYNDILYCLCTDGKGDWELLLRDYPDLKDYLWNEFKELKNAEKRKEMTLIQKRLAKNNEEVDLLISPSKREAKISELLDEGTKLQKQIEEISESLEEIDIV